ncbi:MAG TPA: cyclic nucleotide-binding domain-containing protein [Sedimenticola sp.]|nr:cyclic nucleotide-binding domain-containing protein [Sedimenticola sp.]
MEKGKNGPDSRGRPPAPNGTAGGADKEGACGVQCADCTLDAICKLLDYANGGSAVPDGVLLRERPVARGETIFRIEDPFRSIFAVKSGSFKTLIPEAGGREQVVGFYLPGELLGAEGVTGGAYPCTARALESSRICELRMERLPETGRPLEALQQGLIEILGREVAFGHALMASLIRQSAEQRIAAFILNLSRRLERRGLAGRVFVLTMSRADMGSYLGLASETVSRVLARFQKAGVLTLQKKQVQVHAPERLADIANL